MKIEINAAWIVERMKDFKVKNPRMLALNAGVSYESLNLALNGKRPFSGEIKKTLYWYFRYLDAERQIKEFEDLSQTP